MGQMMPGMEWMPLMFLLTMPVVFGGVAEILHPKVLKRPRGFEVLTKEGKDSEKE